MTLPASSLPPKEIRSLAGHLLVATREIDDSIFAKTVIYVCAHNHEGAMGIIVNVPAEQISIREIYDQLEIDLPLGDDAVKVHFGGPVEAHRGFIVHSTDYESKESLIAQAGVAVTASVAVLRDLAHGRGPAKGMLVLGYAGWGAGQLESEIESGSWIVAPASDEIVFNTNNEQKWGSAIARLGIDIGHFSSQVGHA